MCLHVMDVCIGDAISRAFSEDAHQLLLKEQRSLLTNAIFDDLTASFSGLCICGYNGMQHTHQQVLGLL